MCDTRDTRGRAKKISMNINYSPCYPSVWLRVVIIFDSEQLTPQAMSLHYPKPLLEWFHQYWTLWKGEENQHRVMVLKSYLCWAGCISRVWNHLLPWTVLCFKLSTGHSDREASKKWLKGCLKKKPYVTVISDYRRWSTLVENCDLWHLTINHDFTSFESTHKFALKDKHTSGRTGTLCHQPLTRPWASTTVLVSVYHASALSTMDVPAVGVDRSLLGLCPRNQVMIDWLIYEKFYLVSFTCKKWHL